MLEALARDIRNAQSHDFILGIKVYPRHDVSCPRKGEFCGAFLPNELPDLYPEDCPDPMACCCVSREFVMGGDGTREASLLEQRRNGQSDRSSQIASSRNQPAPTATAMEVVGASDGEPQVDAFGYADIGVMRQLLKTSKPTVWDGDGSLQWRLRGPSDGLLQRLIAKGWVREATLHERLMKFTTIDRLKAFCAEAGLPRNGDKKMLVERVAESASDRVLALTGDLPLVCVTDIGRRCIAELEGRQLQQELDADSNRRLESYQKLLDFCRSNNGHKVVVAGNEWSQCSKLPFIVGEFEPDKAPFLPPGDCPNIGRKPCSCWRAFFLAPDQLQAPDLPNLESDELERPSLVPPPAEPDIVDVHARDVPDHRQSKSLSSVEWVLLACAAGVVIYWALNR